MTMSHCHSVIPICISEHVTIFNFPHDRLFAQHIFSNCKNVDDDSNLIVAILGNYRLQNEKKTSILWWLCFP